MGQLTYVFWGYNSENVLDPLREAMHTQGHHCIVLPDNEKYPSKQAERDYLNSIEFVLITSSHFTRDQHIVADTFPELPSIHLSPLEIIGQCKPKKSIYYPHDLGSPLVLNEPMFAHYFDLILWPLPWYGYAPTHPNVQNVGWIKYAKTPIDRLDNYFYDLENIHCFFYSEIVANHRRYGVKKAVEKLQPIITHNIPIKLPVWPLSNDFETALKASGATIIPAELNSFDIIQHSNLVLSNGLSSIISEAHYMGIPSIAFIEHDIVNSQTQSVAFDGLTTCTRCHFNQVELALNAIEKPPQSPTLKPFDYEGAIQAICH